MPTIKTIYAGLPEGFYSYQRFKDYLCKKTGDKQAKLVLTTEGNLLQQLIFHIDPGVTVYYSNWLGSTSANTHSPAETTVRLFGAEEHVQGIEKLILSAARASQN